MKAFPEKEKEKTLAHHLARLSVRGVLAVFIITVHPLLQDSLGSQHPLGSRSLDSVPGERSCLVHPGNSQWRMGAHYLPQVPLQQELWVGT